MPFRPPNTQNPYPIKGAPLVGGNPGIRQELRDLRNNDKLWNLYLCGLYAFQSIPQDDVLSWFQICGIHGEPYQAWPLDDPLLEKLKVQDTGFCTHSSILFLTWHRPYLALFEGVLYDAVNYVAQQFTDAEGRSGYIAAAKTFRIPYWDWARRDLPVFPNEAADDELVQVKMPASMANDYGLSSSGGLTTIDNPLYSYGFQDGTPDLFKVYGRPRTQRWDDGTGVTIVGPPEGLSPEERKKYLLANMTPFARGVNNTVRPESNLTERILYLLQSYQAFAQVSNNQWDPAQQQAGNPNNKVPGLGFGSFEDVHNDIHGLSGGYGQSQGGGSFDGQMGHIPTSAFDPIFWLHHTNIDRMLAIWQGLHDDKSKASTYVTTKTAESGTWITEPDGNEGISTLLAPFYKNDSTFFDSNDVRSTTTFGYAYPETQQWKFPNNIPAYRADIKRQLANIYANASLGVMIAQSLAGSTAPQEELQRRAAVLATVDAAPAPNNTATLLSVLSSTSGDSAPAGLADDNELISALPPLTIPNVEVPSGRNLTDLAKNGKYLEWLVNIKAQKHSLNGRYSVHVFLGAVQEDNTSLYSVSPMHVGTFVPLGQPQGTGCAKCKDGQASGIEITGQIPLTIALAERYFAGALPSFGEEDIKNYLKKNLHWEVIDERGNRLQGRRDQVAGLLVGVYSNEVTLNQQEGELPTYSDYVTVYPEITTKADGSTGRAEGTGLTDIGNLFRQQEL